MRCSNGRTCSSSRSTRDASGTATTPCSPTSCAPTRHRTARALRWSLCTSEPALGTSPKICSSRRSGTRWQRVRMPARPPSWSPPSPASCVTGRKPPSSAGPAPCPMRSSVPGLPSPWARRRAHGRRRQSDPVAALLQVRGFRNRFRNPRHEVPLPGTCETLICVPLVRAPRGTGWQVKDSNLRSFRDGFTAWQCDSLTCADRRPTETSPRILDLNRGHSASTGRRLGTGSTSFPLPQRVVIYRICR